MHLGFARFVMLIKACLIVDPSLFSRGRAAVFREKTSIATGTWLESLLTYLYLSTKYIHLALYI